MLIIGIRCSGKTTLANKIAEHLRRSGEVEVIDDVGIDVSRNVQLAKERSASIIVTAQFAVGNMNKIDFDYYIYASDTISRKSISAFTAGKIMHGSNMIQIENDYYYPFSAIINTTDEKIGDISLASLTLSSASAL